MPEQALGWKIDGAARRFESRRRAYYAIAKRLVIEKYPPGLTYQEPLIPPGWSHEKYDIRSTKAVLLFCNDEPGSFDSARWKRFVHRVARFLMFVDSRRTAAAQLAAIPDVQVQLEFQRIEREACMLMERAQVLRRVLDERGARDDKRES